ncbi:hypothetical protein B0A55_00871 [Friedmanniomyces simplex]|uniref:Uncharacterized protein n=1 Tax=Friedmanniomyces simplex TaxID=329884 RepID=A0A4U0XYL6_9PEZI|nr:hypothetical protein B0A55_00871 [Friedmanniomyces simplex]
MKGHSCHVENAQRLLVSPPFFSVAYVNPATAFPTKQKTTTQWTDPPSSHFPAKAAINQATNLHTELATALAALKSYRLALEKTAELLTAAGGRRRNAAGRDDEEAAR